MEVFNVLATMNLVDMVSSPLDKINKTIGTSKNKMQEMDKAMNTVLTNSMFPLAIAAGAVVTAFGACITKAIEFESSMADVAKVVNFTSESELKGMEKAILDMSTQIPMAADGIAAIIANAAQSGVAKENLMEFAEQAAKMGVAFDLTGDQAGKMMADWKAGMGLSLQQTYDLADAVNHLSNNMNATAPALGEVLQRAGALGMVAGALETEVAALGAAFLSAGASPEVAATALKKFTGTLTKGAAMTDTQAKAFAKLGFNAEELAKRMQVDAKGAIFDVMNALAKVPKEMHGAMLTQMFGEESIGAIAPLLKNMDTLSNAFDLVSDKSKYAGSMQAEFEARSKTVANAIQLLQNKLTKLGIIIGSYLLPAVSFFITIFSKIIDCFTLVIETPLGKVFTEIAGAISLATAAIAVFFLASKVGGFILPMLTKAITALKTSFLTLSLPIQVLIVSMGLLYLAYKANFGGIADSINSFYTKAKIVFQAIIALLANFKNGSASITGDLAKQIKDNGLEKVVTVLFKVFRRLKAIVLGVFEGISTTLGMFYKAFDFVFSGIIWLVEQLITFLGFLGLAIGDKTVQNQTKYWKMFGNVLGVTIGIALAGIGAFKAWSFISLKFSNIMKNVITVTKGLGTALKFVAANPLVLAFIALIAVIGLVIYYFDDIVVWLEKIKNYCANAFGALASWLSNLWNDIVTGVSDAFTAAWESVSNFINKLSTFWDNLKSFLVALFKFAFESIKTILVGGWNFIIDLFSGKSLYESGAALINTFKDGILSAWNGLKESFSDVLGSLRNMLPFSDAKEGPLSTLTLSGNRLISTIGEGVGQAAPAFIKDVNGVFSQINPTIDSPTIDKALDSYVNSTPVIDFATSTQKNHTKINQSNKEHGKTSYTINIQNITLPNVQQADDFIKQLENELISYGV